MLMESNTIFNDKVKCIIERLENRIPFNNIDIDNLHLEKKPSDAETGCPEGVINDHDYDYCYKNLLIETK